jgi:hypothetical protein
MTTDTPTFPTLADIERVLGPGPHWAYRNRDDFVEEVTQIFQRFVAERARTDEQLLEAAVTEVYNR